MRISDWSADGCSSDLVEKARQAAVEREEGRRGPQQEDGDGCEQPHLLLAADGVDAEEYRGGAERPSEEDVVLVRPREDRKRRQERGDARDHESRMLLRERQG